MDEKIVKSIIESLMFAWGEPLNIKVIADIINLPSEFIRKCIMDLKREYEKENRGIQIIEINNHFQLCTNYQYFDYIQKLCTPMPHKTLTQAALEVLAIIAYKQPITKHEIENIRGVKSDKVLNTLIEKELITEKGRLEKVGHPILYGTTDLFLKSFGLTHIEALPEIDRFKSIDLKGIEKTDE